MITTTSLPLLIFIGLCGIILLVYAADHVVEKSIKLAYHYGLSEVFIGLTIISIGTSIPEISSNIIGGIGMLTGNLDPYIGSATVLGANVGSSIVQQTLIIGLVTVLIGSLKFKKLFLAENYIALIATFIIVFILAYDGIISRSDSMIMIVLFVLYLYFLYRQEHKHKENSEHKVAKGSLSSSRKARGLLSLGFFGVFVGSATALESIQSIVTITGVSGGLLGAISIGIAGALPEFITSISAIKKNAGGITVGTLIGSNIVNPLMGIGAGGLIAGYFVPNSYIQWDMPVQIITACLLLLRVNTHQRAIPRYAGFILIGVYIAYVTLKIIYFNSDY